MESRSQTHGSHLTTRGAGIAMIAVAASSWGLVPLFVKQAEQSGPIDASVEVLVLFATMAVGSAPAMVRERRQRIARADQPTPWAALFVLAVAEALNVVCLFRAFRSTSVAVAILTHNLAPVLVALAAPALRLERLHPRTVMAAIAGVGGLAVMLQPWQGGVSGDLAGALLGVASAVFLAVVILVNKRLSPRLSGGELMCFRALLALPLLVCLVQGSVGPALHARTLFWLVLAGLGPGVGGGLLFLAGLRRVSASRAATLTLLEPLVAIASVTFLVGEALRPTVIAGAALILAGALSVMLQRSES